MNGEQFAEYVNLSPGYLRQMESGFRVPSFETFIMLCQKLGVGPNDLLLDFFDDIEAEPPKDNFIETRLASASPQERKFVKAMLLALIEYQAQNDDADHSDLPE